MKSFPSLTRVRPVLSCLALGLASVSIVFGLYSTCKRIYHRDYYAFRGAAMDEGFDVKARWFYEEDFGVEDFGLYVKRENLGFWLDVRYLSKIKRPDDKIDGILLESLHEGWRDHQRVIAINSPWWREAGLPPIASAKDFLRLAPDVLPAILKDKSTFPKTDGGYFKDEFKRFLVIRDDPMVLAPVIDDFVEYLD